MKKVSILHIISFTIAIALMISGCSKKSDESAIKEKLIGYWSISQTFSDNMTTTQMEGEGEYMADGTSEGILNFKVSGIGPPVYCTVETLNSWRIEGNYLIEKPIKVDIIKKKGNPVLLKILEANFKDSINKETKALIKHIDDEKCEIFNEIERVATTLYRLTDEE